MMAGISLAQLLQWLGAASVVMFLGSILLVPWIILRLDRDFFLYYSQSKQRISKGHPVSDIVMLALRNIIGILLVAAGLAMLVLPGQGILTLLAGLIVMQFPGKHFVLARVVRNPKVQKGLNWIRSKGKKSPFIFSSLHNSANSRYE